MEEIKTFSDTEKMAAWKNTGGTVNFLWKPTGKLKCPYKGCKIKVEMDAERYGFEAPDEWVVDLKVPLAKGGTNDIKNLQVMHNACKNLKLSGADDKKKKAGLFKKEAKAKSSAKKAKNTKKAKAKKKVNDKKGSKK